MANTALSDSPQQRAAFWREFHASEQNRVYLEYRGHVDLFSREGFLAPVAVARLASHRVLHLGFAVPDRRLAIELAGLRKGSTAPLAHPAVILAFSSNMTYADIAATCGHGTRPEVVLCTFLIGISSEKGERHSAPLEGRIIPLALSTASEWFLFDCHSHWEIGYDTPGVFGPYTVCHGPCPAGTQCRCFDFRRGKSQTTCQGWQFCVCS